METKIALLLFYLMLGCGGKHKQLSDVSKVAMMRDTLPATAFYELNYINSDQYVIEWGTSSFKNTSKDTFDVLGSGFLELSESNSKYLVLSQPCGSGCALYVLLPFSSNEQELVFWNVVYHNLNKETIVTTVDPGLGKFEITQYGTNTKQEVILEDLCPAADKPMSIDSIFIDHGEIHFEYEGSKWEYGKQDKKVKKVRLNQK